MKPKHVVVIIGMLLGAGALCFGHSVWRAHRQLVTLDVREVPLADVLRKIERQTWTKIRAEKGVDARITLRVKDAPLRSVLDRIGQQAGARWSTLYAVYDSKHALKALDLALRGDGKLEQAGWTRVAPKFASPDQSPEKSDSSIDSPSFMDGKPNEMGPSISRQGGKPPPDVSESGGGQRRMMIRTGPNGSVFFQGGPNGQIELWSPEELLVESSLNTRIGAEGATPELKATADSAAQSARAVNGKWTTYFAFRRSNLGLGFSGPPPRRQGLGAIGLGPRHNPNDRFANLTPSQRVQQARERLAER